MKTRIPLPRSFSFDAVARSHGWYDLPPFAYDPAGRILATVVERETPTPENEVATLEFAVADGALWAKADGLGAGRTRAATTRIFSLDLDFSDFAASLAEHPELTRALERGGGRMLRAPTLFEDAVKMLLTTNCSWAATRGMVVRLIVLAGAGGRAFPGPERIARFSTRALREKVRCGYRAEALRLFARRVAEGRLDLALWEDRNLPAAEVRAAILAERGFGPYAAEGLLRILGRHDYLALDSWTRQKYRRLYPGPAKKTDRSIARRYARFGPYRGLAMWLDLTGDWHDQPKPTWP